MAAAFGKAVIAGCMRDCAAALPDVLSNIEALAGLYREAAFVFVENDSRDQTKAIVQVFCARHANAMLLDLDGLAQTRPVRTIRLETARNEILAHVKSHHRDYDHLILIDCDDASTRPLDLDAVRRAIEFLDAAPDRAGVFANQDGPYYDMWALRHRERCPGDVWEEVLDRVTGEGLSDQAAFDRTFAQRIFSLPPDAEPMEVDSAFGGLGIYKISSVLKNQKRYVGHHRKLIPTPQGPMEFGWQVCEHVAFHAGFREQGERLFVIPDLINRVTHGIQFPSSAYRTMVFDLQLAQPQRKAGTRISTKTGRNDPCPCGSGKRYKQCHGR